MLAQCVEQVLQYVASLLCSASKKGLLRESSWDVFCNLLLILEVRSFALHTLILLQTLAEVDVLVGARLDQSEPVLGVTTQ